VPNVGRDVKVGPYTRQVIKEAVWRADGSPRNQGTANDWEHHFSWAHRHGQFDRFLPRLQARPRERDAAIAEIRAAHFLESLGFSIISWEPAATERPGEFEIQWPDTAPVFVEVKRPTWESELSEDERATRKQLPKALNGDGRWTDTRVEVHYAAQKTIGKLPIDRPSLLVIVDDLVKSAVRDLEAGDLSELLAAPDFIGLGGILCIDAQWIKSDGSGVDYSALFEANPRARGTAWELPVPAVTALAAASERRTSR
jgi:hypothetical protein